METIQSINLIATNPKVRNGRPIIVGTGIEVAAIMIQHLVHQQTLDEIAVDYKISLAEVYAALAYYYQHQETIDAATRAQNQLADAMREAYIAKRNPPLST